MLCMTSWIAMPRLNRSSGTWISLCLLSSALFLWAGCDTNDPATIRLSLNNPDFEEGVDEPAHWQVKTGAGGARLVPSERAEAAYLATWSTDASRSASHSVAIRFAPPEPLELYADEKAVWQQFVTVSPSEADEAAGRSIVLRSYVKAENLEGQLYAHLLFYNSNGDPTADAARLEPISNTQGWEPFFLVRPSAPAGITRIEVRLGITGARSGVAYFDDLELSIE